MAKTSLDGEAGVEDGGDSKTLKVVIAGGGPAGLLAAHYLLAYGNGRFHVCLYDKGDDPRDVAAQGFNTKSNRRYSMSLAPRGYKSIAAVKGLADALEGVLTPITSAAFLLFGRLWKMKTNKNDEKGYLVDRMNLCSAMAKELDKRYSKSGLLEMRFNVACAPDLERRCVNVMRATGEDLPPTGQVETTGATDVGMETVKYDLLIGADGVRSNVRRAIAERHLSFHVEQRDIFNEWFSIAIPRPDDYDPNRVYFIPKVPGTTASGAIGLTADKDTVCFAMGWPPNKVPNDLLNCTTPEEVKAFFDRNLPFLHIPAHLAWSAITQRRRTTLMVKCGEYHDAEGRAVLTGDAAHATSPAIGNGCNASLVDAAVLSRLILGERIGEEDRIPAKPVQQTTLSTAEIKRRLPDTLQLFSALQVREGHALVDLSWAGAPLDKRLAIWEAMKLIFLLLVTTLLPFMKWFIYPPIQKMLQDGVPYNEILTAHRRSVEAIITSNNRIRDAWSAELDAAYVANYA